MKKLLIVKTGSTYESIKQMFGDFEDMLINALEIQQQSVDVFDAKDEFLVFPRPDKYAGIVILGSHDMLTFNEDWMLDLKEWILTITDTETPTLGICFGHQAMAEALGGEVDYREWGPEVGYVKVKLASDAYSDILFSSIYDKAGVYQYHSQTVKVLPKDCILLGSNNIEFYQILKYNNHMWSCQFHPEFTHEIVAEYIKHNAIQLTSEGLDPYKLLNRLQPDESGKKLLKRFLEVCKL